MEPEEDELQVSDKKKHSKASKDLDPEELTSVVVDNPEGQRRRSIEDDENESTSSDGFDPYDAWAPWELELYPVMDFFENTYPGKIGLNS